MRKAYQVIVTITAAVLLGSCSLTPQQRAQKMDPMLAAAGFKQYPADTPQKSQTLKNLPPLKLTHYTGKDGTLRYWVSDPYECQCMYVGTQGAYQRYEAIRIQNRMVEEEQEAAQENMEASEDMMMMPPYGFGPGFEFGY
ncbi:MAG TPA: hypothetical protein VMA09_05040 [Candidatus Binataceae bacterium]|nr:hypothetical protein [Candidatus Binataceae bacterium]